MKQYLGEPFPYLSISCVSHCIKQQQLATTIKQQQLATNGFAMRFGVPFCAFILLFAVLGYSRQIPSEKWKGDHGIVSENQNEENQNETFQEFEPRQGK